MHQEFGTKGESGVLGEAVEDSGEKVRWNFLSIQMAGPTKAAGVQAVQLRPKDPIAEAQDTIREVIRKLAPVEKYHRIPGAVSERSKLIGNIMEKLRGELVLLMERRVDAETASTIHSYTRSISNALDEPANPGGIATQLHFLGKFREWGRRALIKGSQAGLYFGHLNPSWKSYEEKTAEEAQKEADKAKLDKARQDLKEKGPEFVDKLNAAADGLELKGRAGDAANVRKLAVDYQQKLAQLARDSGGTGATVSDAANTVGDVGDLVTGPVELSTGINSTTHKIAWGAGLVIEVATGTVATLDAIGRQDAAGALKNLGTTVLPLHAFFSALIHVSMDHPHDPLNPLLPVLTSLHVVLPGNANSRVTRADRACAARRCSLRRRASWS